MAKVVRCYVGSDRKVKSSYDDNTILNTILYEFEFPDGTLRSYAANIIANSIYNQVEVCELSCAQLQSIVEYKRDGNAVDKADQYVVTKRGQRKL